MAQKQAQQGGGGGGSDNSMAPVWIMVLLFFTCFFIWKMGHQHIVAAVFSFNVYQARLINFFIQSPILQQQIYLMQTIDPMTVTWDQFLEITRTVGDYLRYPVIALLIVLALFLYHSNIKLKFRKTYNMKTLRAQEQYNWMAIMPVVKEDLVNTDLDKGPWATALTPMEFARRYHLLKKEDSLSESEAQKSMIAAVRKDEAKRVFTLQLGPFWEGFDRCQPHVKALAAIFMARINRDRNAAKSILEALDRSISTGKPNFLIADATLRKYLSSEGVQEILAKHAYLLTMLASLLEAARQDGVVPSSEFLWLKPLDRRLWYMLNSIGRQTPFAEVAGPFAHWRAEKVMGRRSMVPMIDEATKALELAIKEVKLSPKELKELKS